jgi:hypothetical protein
VGKEVDLKTTMEQRFRLATFVSVRTAAAAAVVVVVVAPVEIKSVLQEAIF